MLKKVLLGLLALVLIGGAAFWWKLTQTGSRMEAVTLSFS